MDRKSPVNSVYLIALACCCLVAYVHSLFTALLFAAVVVVCLLIGVSIVSMIEKIADKHVRFLIFSMISAAIVVIFKVVLRFIDVKEVALIADVIDMAVVVSMLLAIVPIYFEDALTVKQFFTEALLISLGFTLMLTVLGVLVEIFGYGEIAGVSLGFNGMWFFTMPFGIFMLIAVLAILFNIVRRTYLKNTRKFDMLVEKYKIQIREIKSQEQRKQKNGGDK